MFDLFRMGQGPRPDLLEKELKQDLNLKTAMQKRDGKDAAQENQKPKRKAQNKLDFQHKDIVAMILALFQLLFPWIAGGILIYFVVIFLITLI